MAVARVGRTTGEDDVCLEVGDGDGSSWYRAALRLPTDVGPRGTGPGAGAGDGREAPGPETDAELADAGWTRCGAWARTRAGGSDRADLWEAPVAARPRAPLTPSDQRALQVLGRLTSMARGPVTAAALVPHVAPQWQAAVAVVRRLVAAGRVRGVGRTAGRISRALYAPVGSPWAPTPPDQGQVGGRLPSARGR